MARGQLVADRLVADRLVEFQLVADRLVELRLVELRLVELRLVDGPRACLHVKTQTRPTRTNKHKHGPQQLRQQLGDQVARPANQATRCTDTGSTPRAPSNQDQGPGMPGGMGAEFDQVD